MLKNNFKFNRGIIEIVTIITALSFFVSLSLLTVSSQGAQNIAQDASIEAQLSQIRSAAELYRLNKKTYIGLKNDNNIILIQKSIEGVLGENALYWDVAEQKYCVAVETLTSKNESFCIDSAGRSGKFIGSPEKVCIDSGCSNK